MFSQNYRGYNKEEKFTSTPLKKRGKEGVFRKRRLAMQE
jgi:hypothetical protein